MIMNDLYHTVPKLERLERDEKATNAANNMKYALSEQCPHYKVGA
jgi:hypothetical protein